MTQKEKGKNIFQQAMDAVTNRDEKAAIEAAMKRAEELEKRADEAEKKLAAAEQRNTQMAQKLAEAEGKVSQLTTNLAALKTSAAETEKRLVAANVEIQKYASAEQARKYSETAAAALKAQVLTEHTLKADETLSHLSLKYYGSAYEPYWRVIYEANKELIGDNPARVRPGMVIKIPVLPEELKKK